MFALPRLSPSRISHSSFENRSCEQNEGLIDEEVHKKKALGFHTRRPRLWFAWTAALLTVGFQTLTSIYASGTFIASHLHLIYNSSSNTIFVLSVLSSFTGVFLSATIATTFEKVQWMLISRQKGLRVSQYLTLQAGTGVMGLFTLLLGKGLGWGSSTRGWAAVRLGTIVLGPILGMLIMSDVHTQEVFEILDETPTTLGWGMSLFNASLANNVSAIANQVVQADLAMFLSEPYRTVDLTTPQDRSVPCSHIPGKENERNCRRVYYIPGGMDLAATREVKETAKTEVILAQDQQGYILDFTEGPGVGEDWDFEAQTECKVYGFPFGAFHLCLRNGAANTLEARIVPCPESVSSLSDCMTNTTWPSAPGWTTSLTTSFRKGTVAYSLANGTILAHTFTNDPIPAPVSAAEMLAGYRSAFSEFDSLTAILSAFADPGVADMFPLYVYPAMVWANLKSISSLSIQNPAIATRAQDTLQCLLGIMLFYCQPSLFSSALSIYLNDSSTNDHTYIGGNDVKKLKDFARELAKESPPDTKVHQAVRRYQLRVGKSTLFAYIALSGMALLACIVALGWTEWLAERAMLDIPKVGPFPAWNERVHCKVQEGSGGGEDEITGNSVPEIGRGTVRLAEEVRIILATME